MKHIVVALDGIPKKKALRLARSMKGLVWGFKVNDLLFEDPKIIRRLRLYGKVFADAKLHDIPNTVQNSIARLALLKATIISVHASAGLEMMKAAKQVAGQAKVVGITVLTSTPGNVKKQVLSLAADAQTAGLDGIVCSAEELPLLKNFKGLKIVPGIRPKWYSSSDDQRRTASPSWAIQAGANLLVIGRPITKAKDPVATIKKILQEL
jgi:orotidine-5'-phosphate decarboxylase